MTSLPRREPFAELSPLRCAEDIRRSYDLGEAIGSGTYSAVYTAVHHRTGETHALKRMAKADATLARKESQLLGALDSPFCADLLGVYEDDRHVWLASTLHVGGELFHRIVDNSDRGATFSEPEAAAIFAQPSCCLGQLLSTELCCRDNSWPRQQQRKSAAAGTEGLSDGD